MSISSRIETTIESWSTKWKDRLRGWMVSWVERGLSALVSEVEPGLSLTVEDTLLKIHDDPNTPEDLKDLIKKITAPGHPLPMLLIVPLAILFLIPTITSIFRPAGNLWEYKQERVLKTARFDPISVITAWRRDPEKYADLFDDLRDQGWSDKSIEALKFITMFIPSAQDQINWLAKEVFEPDMIDRYGLKDELPEYGKTDFAKIGVDPTQMANYWMAHWEHASYIQVVEMLRRGLLTLSKELPTPPDTKEGWATRDAEGIKALYDWYRLIEIPPFWRDRLTEMVWEVPTRVDVRRWWDMRTIPESELYSIYHRQGYHGKDLDNYVKWTKVYTDFPMMMTRFTNGWITEEDIRTWLKGLEIPEDRIDQFIQEKTKPEKAARTTKEKDLTKTEIYKGVKKETITWPEGLDLLRDLGYDEWEAEYILAINVGVLEGSPESYAEFKDLTQKWRISAGMEAKPMTEEIRAAAQAVILITRERDSLQRSIEEEKRGLVGEAILPAEATARLKALQKSLRQAEAALSAAKTEYDSKLAEWRHGG